MLVDRIIYHSPMMFKQIPNCFCFGVPENVPATVGICVNKYNPCDLRNEFGMSHPA